VSPRVSCHCGEALVPTGTSRVHDIADLEISHIKKRVWHLHRYPPWRVRVLKVHAAVDRASHAVNSRESALT
jgi:PHP family Zn ribbon phosphoesterase